MARYKKSKQREKVPMRISTRLFLGISGLLILFIALIIFVDSRFLGAYYMFSSVWDLWDLSSEINEEYNEGHGDYYFNLKTVENQHNVDIEIITVDGRLVYSSDYVGPELKDGETLDSHLIRQFEIVSSGIKSGSKYLEIQRDNSDPAQSEYLLVVEKMENGNTINIYKAKRPLDEGSEVAIQFLLYMTIGLFLVIIVAVRIFSLRFSRPLAQISSTTKRLAMLDFSEKCPPSNIKEIAVLNESINNMSQSLEGALDELKEKNKKLQEDIEKERTMEHLRSSFIANVSHELKTPIAIIQGYSEGLKLFMDSDPETAREYCEVIIEETNRMHELVMKLLEIMRYDSGDYELSYESFLVHDLLEDWFIRDRNILAEKNISYVNDINPRYVGRGDSVLLGSVVNNFLSNAVSHIDGERLIKVWADDLGGVYRVSVFNSGVPISDKDIDKIWTSFYRADKSMSRAEGRFGLGLSIVSSIQNLHGHQFGVENMPDGVRFWFDIEKTDNLVQ